MGKVKQWLMNMEEDAQDMSAQEFIKKYGKDELHIWSRIQWELGNDNIDEQYLAVIEPHGSA